MASFYDITLGQMVEFQRVLASAGFTDSDIARIIKEPNLVSTMYASIERKLNTPVWWRTPEQQLERARQLWPDIVLPEPPEEFTPRTKSEVLLLHVRDSLESLWEKVVAPKNYSKLLLGVDLSQLDRRYVWGEEDTSLDTSRKTAAWLAFDPEYDRDPQYVNGGLNEDSWFANEEVLSALIQFPDWALEWEDNGTLAPLLFPCAYKDSHDFTRAPGIDRDDGSRELLMSNILLNGGEPHCSPSVREC